MPELWTAGSRRNSIHCATRRQWSDCCAAHPGDCSSIEHGRHLCYVAGFVTGIFFLVAEPYKHDPFVRFHALQSIFVSVVWIGVHFAISILLSALPWSLWSTITLLSELVSLACLLLFLLLMYKAYSNERFKLPIVGDLAERQV